MSTAAWHAASEKSVMEALMTDKASGLTKKEVRNRARRYGLNRIYKEERASGLQYLGYCFSDLMLMMGRFGSGSGPFGLVCMATYYPAEILLAHGIFHAADA